MIINFQINNIDSKAYFSPEDIKKYKHVNINYDVNIRNPSVVMHKTISEEKKVLRLEYTFAINYLSPNIGHIRFEGFSYYYADTDIDKLKEKWDTGKAPVDVQNEIANNIVSNISPIALLISKSLGLPPSIPIPVINFQKTDKKKREPTHYHG